MPFCPSCGSKISEGKNFCSQCGKPVNPEITPPVSQPLEKPRGILSGSDKIVVAVLCILVIGVIAVYFTSHGAGGGGTGSSASGNTNPPVTVASGTVSPYGTPTVTAGFQATYGPVVYRSGVPYVQVYSKQYEQGSARGVFSYTLQDPPLLVECDMNPVMVTRNKLVDIGTSNERYITATYADPSAWLDLKVRNADTDQVITTIRFSKNYEGTTQQDYTIRAPGNYRFEMAGSLVSPTVRLLLKK